VSFVASRRVIALRILELSLLEHLDRLQHDFLIRIFEKLDQSFGSGIVLKMLQGEKFEDRLADGKVGIAHLRDQDRKRVRRSALGKNLENAGAEPGIVVIQNLFDEPLQPRVHHEVDDLALDLLGHFHEMLEKQGVQRFDDEVLGGVGEQQKRRSARGELLVTAGVDQQLLAGVGIEALEEAVQICFVIFVDLWKVAQDHVGVVAADAQETLGHDHAGLDIRVGKMLLERLDERHDLFEHCRLVARLGGHPVELFRELLHDALDRVGHDGGDRLELVEQIREEILVGKRILELLHDLHDLEAVGLALPAEILEHLLEEGVLMDLEALEQRIPHLRIDGGKILDGHLEERDVLDLVEVFAELDLRDALLFLLAFDDFLFEDVQENRVELWILQVHQLFEIQNFIFRRIPRPLFEEAVDEPRFFDRDLDDVADAGICGRAQHFGQGLHPRLVDALEDILERLAQDRVGVFDQLEDGSQIFG